MRPFWGKYRGKIVDNNDPSKNGRIQPLVPAISDKPLNWAMPCVPYAGPLEGIYAMPPLDANVWIEFEGGDLNYPIWTGGFWEIDEVKTIPSTATDPTQKVWQTDKITLVFDDAAGEMRMEMEGVKGTMRLVMNGDGIVLTADTVSLSVLPEGIELKKDSASVEINDGITLKNGAASAVIQPASISLKNGGASINMSPAAVDINNGALEVM